MNISQILLESNAIQFDPINQFVWSSGSKNPIYCDNRKILFHPDHRKNIVKELARSSQEFKPEVIAGVATGGIAIGSLIAAELDLPFVYVRSKAKKHGLGNTIEGGDISGKRVLLIEDLISTGKSSYSCIERIRESKGEISGILSIFNYGFDRSIELFDGIHAKSLVYFQDVLFHAIQNGKLNDSDVNLLNKWWGDLNQ